MSDIQSIGSFLTDSLLVNSAYKESTSEKLQKIQEKLKNLPSVLDESTLTKLKNGDYEISLREYTDMNSYNTMMTALYGNKSANSIQNIFNITTDAAENSFENAKSFVQRMKEQGMSNAKAVKTYTALYKYSLMSSYKNYNFISARV